MLTNRKPINRGSGFKRPEPKEKVCRLLQPIRQDVKFGQQPAKLPIETPKENPVRSEGYRRLVASLPCYRCGVENYSQCAHGDAGKGMGIKANDLTCYPLCCTRPGLIGCHYFVGTSGKMTREERRQFEEMAAFDTFHELKRRAHSDGNVAAIFEKMEVKI